MAYQQQYMAEKVSGLLALGTIATLLCCFIPTATYTIYRTIGRRLRGGYRGFDLVALLITITTLGAILYIVIDAQHLYPRCDTYGDPRMLLCSVDRYDDTGATVALPRDQAAAMMRSDLLADIVQCLIVPSTIGIAVLLILTHYITIYQKTRIENEG